ncbi:PREDICTED: solute carrier family 22 member 13-like [Calidris pugnax]|uniref:solute carrier family 22 member 13-like n=1 Tax=Calidris pugnax TaxID=198806 RepID=UPI00071C7FCE|nr:PREDICTED: solute carrier family 22 member 13-like [Calidris pugnax]
MSGVGEILKAVGDFGPFQKRLVLLSVIPCLSVAFHQFCQLFMVPHVPHHCDTSWIRAVGPNLTEEEQLNLTLPRDAEGSFEQCSMYSPVDWDLDSIVTYGLNTTEKCSSGWVYPSAEPPSLLTEFDLVCDRKELHDIAQSVYMLGLFLGSMIFGPLSDRIGRRPIILISVFLQGLFGVGIALVPHFYVYMAFRCVVGASVSGITMTILALATEWIGVSSRPKAVLTSHCCFAIGQMILAGLSYGIRNWRLLQIAGSAPIFAFFFSIQSSNAVLEPKWQPLTMPTGDGLGMDRGGLQLQLPCTRDQLKPETQTKSGSTLDLFRKKHLRNVTLIMSCAWFVNSLVYYGLSLNVTNFGLDIYLTQLAFGAVEIPARVGCIFLLQWFGRKKTQVVLLVLSGLVCLIITGIPEDQPVVTTVLATIGKFTASASFSTSYVYAAELFPTVIRQTGVGLCSMSARVAGIVAPLIRLLSEYHRAIPMAIFGSTPVVGGLLCILLPETSGTDLADETRDGCSPAEMTFFSQKLHGGGVPALTVYSSKTVFW